MRVLLVTRQFPPHGVGGIGSYVGTLARMLVGAGHDVTVLVAGGGSPRATEGRDGYTVEWFPAIGPARVWGALERRWLQPAVGLRAALSAGRAVRALGRRFDVIEAPEWKSEGLLLGRRRGPVVVHLHLARELVRDWSDLPAGRSQRTAERLERRSARRAAAVTATSRLSNRRPDGARWLEGVDVQVVPPPMDTDEWAGAPPIEATEPVVVFAGHIEKRKAPDALLAAVARLTAEGSIDGLRVVFAGRPHNGPDGSRYDRWLRAEANRLGVACEILPLQTSPDAMRAIYARARVVAVPSRFETLSMVVLEAFLADRPVVLTTATGAAEWVGGAVPELVVEPDDVAALAAALRGPLTDVGVARRLAAAGRDAVAAACAPEAIVGARVAVYERAASSRRV